MAQISTNREYQMQGQGNAQDDVRSDTPSEVSGKTRKRRSRPNRSGFWQQIGAALQQLAYAILWLEPVWLLLLAPSLLLRDLFWDPWLHPWLVAALFLFWPLRLLVERRLAPATPLNAPIYGLLIWIPVGLWMVIDPEVAWHAAGFLLLGVAAYFALLNWQPTQRRPWLVALMLMLFGLLLTAVGPELLLRVPQKLFYFSEEVARSEPIDLFGWGETVNPNVLAGALLLPIPLVVALAVRTGWSKRRWAPPLLLLFALPMVVTLILAQSRGSYLALLLALLFVIIVRWPWIGLAIGITVVTMVGVFALSDTTFYLGAFGSDGNVTSFSGRLEIWVASLQAVRDYALTGVGLGHFALVVPAAYPAAVWNGQIPHAHNLLLQVGIDLGLPGLLCYAWLIGVAIHALVVVIRNDGYVPSRKKAAASPPRYRADMDSRARARVRRQRVHARRRASLRWALAVGTLGALIAMLAHGLVDAVTWGTKLAFVPWFLYALTALLTCQTEPVVEE